MCLNPFNNNQTTATIDHLTLLRTHYAPFGRNHLRVSLKSKAKAKLFFADTNCVIFMETEI